MPGSNNSEAYWAGWRYAMHGCPPSLANPYSSTLEAVEFELGAEAGRQAEAELEAWEQVRHDAEDEHVYMV